MGPRPPIFEEGFGSQIVRNAAEYQLGGIPNAELSNGVFEATISIPEALAKAELITTL